MVNSYLVFFLSVESNVFLLTASWSVCRVQGAELF